MLSNLKDWILVSSLMVSSKGSSINAGERFYSEKINFPIENLQNLQISSYPLPLIVWITLLGLILFLAILRYQSH